MMTPDVVLQVGLSFGAVDAKGTRELGLFPALEATVLVQRLAVLVRVAAILTPVSTAVPSVCNQMVRT